MKAWMAVTAVLVSAAPSMAQPTFEAQGFPISQMQAQVLNTAQLSERVDPTDTKWNSPLLYAKRIHVAVHAHHVLSVALVKK